jgi:predicted phosphohydrolase
MESFKFQLFSDIHLEFSKKSFPKIPKLEEYLILAGDIGKINTSNFKDFFDYCSLNWKKVFYILGNHEYYSSNKSFNRLNEDYHIFIKQYPNVFLLDNSHYDISPNFRIIGSTLWSNPASIEGFNDFVYIKEVNDHINRKLGMSIETFKRLHKESVDYLIGEISKNDKNLLVITHFPPTQQNTSHPKYKNQSQIIRDYFASNMIDNIPKIHKIKSWIFGHTHYSTSVQLPNNIRLMSNQMGYPNESDINMNGSGIFEIIL